MITSACATALAGLSSTKQSSSGSVDLHGAHFRGWNKYAGTYPAKMSTVVLIFADGAQIRARIFFLTVKLISFSTYRRNHREITTRRDTTQIRARICAPVHVYAGGGGDEYAVTPDAGSNLSDMTVVGRCMWCSRVRVRRVVVPKNIQPARRPTKCSWTTTLTGKLQVSASTCAGVPVSVLNIRTQSDCACRGHGQACLDQRILLVSQTVVESIQLFIWSDAPSWVKRHEPNRLFFRPQRSLSKRLQTRPPSTY